MVMERDELGIEARLNDVERLEKCKELYQKAQEDLDSLKKKIEELRNELKKRRIKRYYDNTVLTIYEAKGLERENIVCIGLMEEFEEDARVVVERL